MWRAELPVSSIVGLEGISAETLSGSIAIYRPQAELFGGKSDGEFVVRLGKFKKFQVVISAGDN
jgi:hypothetical protein